MKERKDHFRIVDLQTGKTKKLDLKPHEEKEAINEMFLFLEPDHAGILIFVEHRGFKVIDMCHNYY